MLVIFPLFMRICEIANIITPDELGGDPPTALLMKSWNDSGPNVACFHTSAAGRL